MNQPGQSAQQVLKRTLSGTRRTHLWASYTGTHPHPYTKRREGRLVNGKKVPKPTGEYIAYLRVSTGKQGQSGLGLEAQQATVVAYVAGRGGTIVESFVEVESGSRNDRPELAKALATCKTLKAVLVIAKLDRLARNVHFISGLMESGVEFVAADMPGATRFMLHVYAAVAEEERRMIAQRTKEAMTAAKARGVDLGKSARRNREMATEYAMQFGPILRLLRSEGFVTIRAITAALNERGVPSREGGRWYLRSTQMMLKRLGRA